MQLKVRRTTKNKVVTIELETINFTEKENDMLDQLGEPIIEMDTTYGNNSVKFSKKIRSNFKVKVKFDANLESDTEATANYIETFLETVQEQLSQKMERVLDQYNENLIPMEQVFEITY